MLKLYIFDALALKEEFEERDLKISDQFETFVSCSNIYFLGMGAQLLQKLATNSSRGKTPSKFTICECRILKKI